jgi:hypothetical protein
MLVLGKTSQKKPIMLCELLIDNIDKVLNTIFHVFTKFGTEYSQPKNERERERKKERKEDSIRPVQSDTKRPKISRKGFFVLFSLLFFHLQKGDKTQEKTHESAGGIGSARVIGSSCASGGLRRSGGGSRRSTGGRGSCRAA